MQTVMYFITLDGEENMIPGKPIMRTNIHLSRGIRNTLKKEVDFSGYEFDKVSTAAKDFIRGRIKDKYQFTLQALHLCRAAEEEASRETERPPVSGPRLAQEG